MFVAIAGFVCAIGAQTLPKDFPVVTTLPASVQVIAAGKSLVLSAPARGAAPLRHQWRRNGVDLPGETSETLVVPSIQSSDQGYYSVLVSNPRGATAGGPLFVWVRDPAPTMGGTIEMQNILPLPRSPILNDATGDRLAIDQWVVQLYVGDMPLEEFLVPVEPPTGLRAPGFFSADTVSVPDIPPGGAAFAQVRVWSIHHGETYDEAAFAEFPGPVGRSPVIALTTGDAADPNKPPARLIEAGLRSFSVRHARGRLPVQVPASADVPVGLPASFTIRTTFDSTFHWRKDGVVILGATNVRSSTLTLPRVQLADAGNYSVEHFDNSWQEPATFKINVVNAATRPVFDGPRLLPSGTVAFALRGVTSGQVTIEGSDDLLIWFPVLTVPATSAPIQFGDPDAANSGVITRFYRAVVVP